MVQLVCFYYVITTFTTVGYGNSILLLLVIHVPPTDALMLYMTGDIYATTDAERVGCHAPPYFFSNFYHCGDDAVSGILYLPVHGRCVYFWNSGFSNQ